MRRSYLLISLSQLSRNVALLKQHIAPSQILVMAKANAYGHGVIPLVLHLATKEQISYFGVASLGEAIYLRKKLPALPIVFVVFSENAIAMKESLEIYENFGCIPILSSLQDIKDYFSFGYASQVPLWIKINAGMNRQGIKSFEIETLKKLLQNNGLNRIDHLLAHMSCSLEPLKETIQNKLEMKEFGRIYATLKNDFFITDTSLESTGAVIQKDQEFKGLYSFCRIGYALYSGMPSQWLKENFLHQISLQEISSFYVAILDQYFIKKNDTIGYNAVAVPRNGWLLILGVGHGDGPFSLLEQKRLDFGNGIKGQFIGQVSMDSCYFLLDADSQRPQPFGYLSFWGENIEYLSFCQQAHVNPYVFITGISKRMTRKYVV